MYTVDQMTPGMTYALPDTRSTSAVVARDVPSYNADGDRSCAPLRERDQPRVHDPQERRDLTCDAIISRYILRKI